MISRFPRTRGDRDQAKLDNYTAEPVPPHARG